MTLRSLTVVATVITLAMPAVAFGQQPAAAAPSPAAAPVAAAPVAAAPAAAVAPTEAPVNWGATPASAPAAAATPPAPRVTPPSPPAPRVRARVTEGNDLIAAGLGTLGAVYIVTSLAGAVIIDRSRKSETDDYTGVTIGPDHKRVNYGRALTVPIVGPFIAMRYTDSAKERWGDAFIGSVQVAGVALAALGLIRKARARRAQRFSVGGGFAAGGASLSVSGRF